MDRKLQFTERAQADSKEAFMLLTKPIGIDHKNPSAPFIDGTAFAEEMYWLKAQGKEVTVKINSVGGNVVQGWTILDAIETVGANTHLIGIGASMAGVIFLGGKRKTSEPYGTLMFHSAHGGNTHYKDIVNAQFRDLLTTRTKLSADKINDILNEGDHYFDSSDMVNFGLVDSAPVNRNKVFTRPVNASVDELFEIYNSLNEIENLKPTKEMDIFAKLFGGKDEQETISLALSAKTDSEKLKAELQAKDTQLSALQAKVAEFEKVANETKAVALIETAIAEKKLQNISAEDKAKLVATAVTNFDAVKLMLDGVTIVPKKKDSAITIVAGADEQGKAVTYEYLAKNDPEKLNAILENDPALYARLEKEYIETSKK